MDYSKLSDSEINNLVDGHIYRDVSDAPDIDYCNDPAHAIPIILSSRIGILPSEMKCKEQWISTSGKGQFEYHENPLRAAMIVFIKMQDAKHA